MGWVRVRLCWVKLDQFRLGKVRLCEVRSGKVGLG